MVQLGYNTKHECNHRLKAQILKANNENGDENRDENCNINNNNNKTTSGTYRSSMHNASKNLNNSSNSNQLINLNNTIDVSLFGSILQIEIILIVYGFLGYILKEMFKNCVLMLQFSNQQTNNGGCLYTPIQQQKHYSSFLGNSFASQNDDGKPANIKMSLEGCSCSSYYLYMLFIYLLSVQILTALLLWRDKKRAESQAYRLWPSTHWLIAFAGGILTSWIVMKKLRFKICVPKYFNTTLILTVFNILWPLLYLMLILARK